MAGLISGWASTAQRRGGAVGKMQREKKNQMHWGSKGRKQRGGNSDVDGQSEDSQSWCSRRMV